MDQEIPLDIRKKESTARILKIIGGIAFLVIVLVGFRMILKPTLEIKNIRTATAELGSIEATISASGIVIPEFEQVITSPITARINQVAFYSGDNVKAGESIMQLDKETILTDLEKLKDEQSLKINKAQQMQLLLEKNLSDLKSQYEIKKLQIASLESLLKDENHLKKIGGSSEYNVRAAELNLEIAKKEALLLEKQIQNQNEANAVDLRGLSFEIGIQEKEINEIERKIELAQVKAQQNGVITWVNEELGTRVSEGEILAKVADLNSFKVEGSISDVYAGKLRNGGDVVVRINKTDLRGRITNIHPAVENGIITFIVKLEGKDHELLRSNLRVEVFVVTSFANEIVRVKNGPFYNGTVDQKVFVVKDGKAIRRKVDIGASNFDFVELKNGIEPGEEVIISDMEDYEHQKEIQLE